MPEEVSSGVPDKSSDDSTPQNARPRTDPQEPAAKVLPLGSVAYMTETRAATQTHSASDSSLYYLSAPLGSAMATPRSELDAEPQLAYTPSCSGLSPLYSTPRSTSPASSIYTTAPRPPFQDHELAHHFQTLYVGMLPTTAPIARRSLTRNAGGELEKEIEIMEDVETE